MSDTVIRVENLGKRYRIGLKEKAPKTLRQAMTGVVGSPFKYLRTVLREPTPEETIWALKDVSFEVKQGDVVGIIGRNGAGKSTLLKILSQITEPSCGYAEIRGRVGSLLEVGTGFHPDLTGRENTYLNGTIMGMKKREIDRRFDEIVAFAEVEKFIDTPVKFYSSGMYTRLAFAVAAHLEPEILIVDEVLAVGDAAFQKKCLGKMGDVATKEGRTVLFVSHNMTAVQSLCTRAIWLKQGQMVDADETGKLVSKYLQTTTKCTLEQIWDEVQSAPGNEQVRLHRVCISPEKVSPSGEITVVTPIKIEFEYFNFVPDACLNLSVVLYNIEDICIFNTVSEPKFFPLGLIQGVCHIPGKLLNDAIYRVRLLIVKDTSIPLLDCPEVAVFQVHDVERSGNWYGQWIGAVRPQLEWSHELVNKG